MFVRIMIIYQLTVLNLKIILKEISKDTLKKLKKTVNTYNIYIIIEKKSKKIIPITSN
jgi:hypothetical protein